MAKTNLFIDLFIIILATTIALSPSFSAGEITGGRNIEIRAEDILILILGIVWIANFLISGRKKIEKPPLFFPILAWLGIGFFSVLVNWVLGSLNFSRGFFYFLKEIEFFFLYFYIFYHIKSINSAKFIIKAWAIFGAINILLIVFQFFKGMHFGTYGPSMFMERGPLPSGAFFLIIFANLFSIFLYYYACLDIPKIKKIIGGLCVLSLTVGVVASGSRTSILGLILVAVLSLFFYQLKRRGLRPFFVALLTFVVLLDIFFVVSEKVPYGRGIENPIGAMSPRIEIWKEQIRLFPMDNLFYILFGMGKSVLLSGEESHSQYVRNFIETGAIGSLAFLFLMFVIIKKSFQGFFRRKEPILIGLSAGLLVSTFAMLFISISGEGFLIVKPNEAYWFFAAITMAVLSFKSSERQLS